MTRRPPAPRKVLSRDLAELEQTDPEVRAAAEKYDAMSAKIRAMPRPTVAEVERRVIDAAVAYVAERNTDSDTWVDLRLAVQALKAMRATCPRPEEE